MTVRSFQTSGVAVHSATPFASTRSPKEPTTNGSWGSKVQKIYPLVGDAIRSLSNNSYRLGETHASGFPGADGDKLLAVTATLVPVIEPQNNTVKMTSTKG
ncbi:MAG: hypothetical protein ACRDRW_11315 [Pseudonocardiaceae bacterium]